MLVWLRNCEVNFAPMPLRSFSVLCCSNWVGVPSPAPAQFPRANTVAIGSLSEAQPDCRRDGGPKTHNEDARRPKRVAPDLGFGWGALGARPDRGGPPMNPFLIA